MTHVLFHGKSGWVAIAGAEYGRYGRIPRTTQDAAVYGLFLNFGADRTAYGKGIVRPTRFATRVKLSHRHRKQSLALLTVGLRRNMHMLRGSMGTKTGKVRMS